MNVEFVDEKGTKTTVDVGDITPETLERALRPTTTTQKLKAFVNNLKIPKEAKLLLLKLQKCVLRSGRVIYKIGIKILEIIILMANRYPNTTMAAIIGAVLWMLLSVIPWLGHVIAVLCGAIFIALGLITDLKNNLTNPIKDDQVNGEIRIKIREIFAIMEGAKVA